jgi:hypothetical protein
MSAVESDVKETRSEAPKRVLVVCQLDRVSNGVKPVEIERFLTERGHQVELVNTYYLGRASASPDSIANKLPPLQPKRLAVYLVEAASRLVVRRSGFLRRRLSYYALMADCRLRRSFLGDELALDEFDLVICETPHDAAVLTRPTRARTLYDCPTPWADELFDDGKLTERQHEKMRAFERFIFEHVDHLAFWWPSYAWHAIEHYGISGSNLMTLNYGCTPSPRRAAFETPPKIAYIGSLSGNAINLPMLARLTRLYPHIDVYGEPEPDPALGLNYRGWAPPSVLLDYQLGLITGSDHELRRNGFSAKHPQYLAHGLPVLVPRFRRHLELLRGSVPYDEDDFVSVVDGLNDEATWRRLSDEAYRQAQDLAWERTLQPLDDLLRGKRPLALRSDETIDLSVGPS